MKWNEVKNYRCYLGVGVRRSPGHETSLPSKTLENDLQNLRFMWQQVFALCDFLC